MGENMNFLPEIEQPHIMDFIDEVYVLAILLDYNVVCNNWEYCDSKLFGEEESGQTWYMNIYKPDVDIALFYYVVEKHVKRMVVAENESKFKVALLNQYDEVLKLQSYLKEIL